MLFTLACTENASVVLARRLHFGLADFFVEKLMLTLRSLDRFDTRVAVATVCIVLKLSVDNEVARLLWLCLRCLTLGDRPCRVCSCHLGVETLRSHLYPPVRQNMSLHVLGKDVRSACVEGLSRFSFLVLFGTMALDVRCTGMLFQVLLLFFTEDSRHAAFLCR